MYAGGWGRVISERLDVLERDCDAFSVGWSRDFARLQYFVEGGSADAASVGEFGYVEAV